MGMLGVTEVASKPSEIAQLALINVLATALCEQVDEHPKIADLVHDDAALCVLVEPLFPDISAKIVTLTNVEFLCNLAEGRIRYPCAPPLSWRTMLF